MDHGGYPEYIQLTRNTARFGYTDGDGRRVACFLGCIFLFKKNAHAMALIK